MKKLLAVLLCLVVVFSLSVTAFAAISPSAEEVNPSNKEEESPKTADMATIYLSVSALASMAAAFAAKKKLSE